VATAAAVRRTLFMAPVRDAHWV